ncbi:xanthine dehydrogenase small subunit [Limnohabitans sp. 63ED37-2]|uniref:xanthine dehydrogenase small subunit n=1 Tax=Limnohabitans sp. 63ED37-2 TaxID=1678128 RepID=UPI0007068767|nr:6-hydroxypseudooxynicotine dehydrogenase complex subunit beta [Limnohabitans sp. 63ED37-2]
MSKTLVSPLKSVPQQTSPLRFWHRGEMMNLGNVPPDRTLLDLLREDLRLTATKEGCAAGDCGACTVVVAEAVNGRLQYRAVNSCIKPAQSIDGLALWTAADLARPDGTLHPVQQAMVACHGSQCGFCTPGFVMSLFALYQRTVAKGQTVDSHTAHEALSGNLCRCTGYRPIVQAACSLNAEPSQTVDERPIVAALQKMATTEMTDGNYLRPSNLSALLQARAQHPQAQLIAGATDAGLWITQGLRRMPQIIDLTRVAELRRVEHYPQHIAIGAAVNLQDAFEALAADRPVIAPFGERFAGWPVRQSGTLGGNVANGSPIGDSMPLLIALGAQVVLMAHRKGRTVHRHVPLDQFYTGYRQSLLAADEVLAWVVVPRPEPGEWLGAYKVSKRQEDDISAVCLAVQLHVQDDHITAARIGAGGVAATPARAVKTEAALIGQPWNEATLHAAQTAMADEFSPLSDLRASADYRRTLLGQLLRRAWLESNGQGTVRLEDLA